MRDAQRSAGCTRRVRREGYVVAREGVAVKTAICSSWVPPTPPRRQVTAPYWTEPVPRYTYRRLTKLPSSVDELRRHTVLNLPGMLQGLRFEHTVMAPGGTVPVSVEEETGVLVFTLAGRGVMELDGDRIEVHANDLVHIPAGVPYGMHTLGGTDWVYVLLQAPVG